MSAQFTHHGSDRSDSHTLSPISVSNRRTWGVAIANDDSTAPPKKRVRLEELGHESSTNAAAKSRRRLDHAAYTVGWVAALPLEMAAATAMLDEIHEALAMSSNDSNLYVFGNIGDHNIVIACLPSGQYGIAKAALVANNMRWSFPSIKIRLMVGIGGGVPGKFDIRLGDVVVSNPTLTSPGVIQYDFGKTVQDGRFQMSGALNKPPQELLAAVAKLRANHESQPGQIPVYLTEMMTRSPSMVAYTYQGAGQDRLYEATYDHIGDSCDDCDLSQLVRRQARTDNYPRIHYGVVASANQVMKHGKTRDRLAKEHDVICFEMEAAGLMDSFPCLVIRGICDYSDSHKVKRWQQYAAATAAAYAKELLATIPWQERQNPESCIKEAPSDHMSLEDRRKTMLDCLKFDQIDSRHSTIKTAHAKTCKWLVKHPDYTTWLDFEEFRRHHGVLWISGKPGAGKSTIMKFAFGLAKKAEAHNAAVLSFFFNARGERLEKTTEGMHRSLLVQLLEKLPALQDVLEDPDLQALPQDRPDCWDLAVLRDLFSRAISKLGQRQVTCFIDALDECAEDEVREMLDFFEDLGQCAAQNGTRLFVCFSSRHYPHIDIEYGVRFTLENQSGHETDLEEYVRSKLRTGTKKQADGLATEIVQKASGVFMWVVLVVDILNKEFQRGRIFAVRERLREIPLKLGDLFRDILTRDNDNMDDLLLCIQWILFGQRSLRLEEYYFALVAGLKANELSEWDPEYTTRESMNLYVISSSKGLAETTRSKKSTVQFIHESVRDFLLKDNGLKSLWPQLGDDPEGKSHERLKDCCHRHMAVDLSSYEWSGESILELSSESLKAFRSEAIEKFPFLEYATKQVLHHANVASRLAMAQDQFIQEFATSLQDWIQLSNLFESYKIRRYTKAATLLYIIVDCSLANLVEPVFRLVPRSGVPSKERYGTPLSAAVHSSNPETIRALLPHLTRDAINEPVDGKRTALCTAVRNGRTEVVEMLLNAGANAETFDHRGITPIITAIEQKNEVMIKMLINAGPSVRDSRGSPILFFFIRQGNEEMVNIFLSAGANPNALDGKDSPVLLSAIENGHEGIINILLNAGANPNALDHLDSPLLFKAIEKGHEGIINILLNAGADPNILDGKGSHILFSAIKHRHEGIVELLLLRGLSAKTPGETFGNTSTGTTDQGNDHQLRHLSKVIVNCMDTQGSTPLQLAVQYECVGIAKLLLDAGADVNSHGTTSKSTLHHLIHHLQMKWGRRMPSIESPDTRNAVSLLKLLLERGADINALDENGCSIIEAAVLLDETAIPKTLLEAGATVYTFGKNDLDLALQQAVRRGNKEVCEFLLKEGADINGMDTEGCSILGTAIQSQNFSIFEFLIDAGANIKQISEDDLDTALSQAVRSANNKMCQLLISKGADSNATDKEGCPVLKKAAQLGDLSVFETLIDAGADVDEIGEDDINTQLGQAIKSGNNRMSKFLLGEGADVNLRPRGIPGPTALHVAIKNGDIDGVKIFLDYGADVHCTDESGKTALHLACETDVTAITTSLVSNGADIEAIDWNGHLPISAAIHSGKVEQLKCLLQLGADVNERDRLGNTPLFEACQLRRLECVRILIGEGADATLVNHYGDNVLFKVAFIGTNLFRLMLEGGADILHRNNSGRLFFEDYYGNIDSFLRLVMGQMPQSDSEVRKEVQSEDLVTRAIEKLVENLAIKEATKEMLLQAASSSHNLDLVRFLMNRGIHPNCADSKGRTPLHQAIESPESNRQIDVILFLLNYGADVAMPDAYGESSLKMALRLEKKGVEAVLRSRLELETNLPARTSSAASGEISGHSTTEKS